MHQFYYSGLPQKVLNEGAALLPLECVCVCVCVCVCDHSDRLWNIDAEGETWTPQIIGFLGAKKY